MSIGVARVRVTTTLPAMRFALQRRLRAHGHQILADWQPAEGAVWVVDLPDGGPVEAVIIATTAPQALVVLTNDLSVVDRVIRAHRMGYACLPRELDSSELDLAVRAAEAGLVLLHHGFLSKLAGTSGRACRSASTLTGREGQVLQLLAEGLPNKAIGRALAVSENTVKFHVASICEKLDAHNRTEAVTLAARAGLLSF